MSTIKIKQVKSRIGAPADQKRTLDALGLRKLIVWLNTKRLLQFWV